MANVAWVGLGGMVGAVARYLTTVWLLRLAPSAWPWGTLAVNVVGCFVIGALPLAANGSRAVLPPELRLLWVTGFLGGFTTFSAFGYETAALADADAPGALLNVAANVGLGLAAVWAGRALVRLWAP